MDRVFSDEATCLTARNRITRVSTDIFTWTKLEPRLLHAEFDVNDKKSTCSFCVYTRSSAIYFHSPQQQLRLADQPPPHALPPICTDIRAEQCSQRTTGTRSTHDIALTLANNSAMPRPIPAAPPVTTATLPANTPHTTIKWCTYFTARRYTGIEIHLAVSWLTSVLRLPPQCKGQTVLDSSERMDAMFADRA